MFEHKVHNVVLQHWWVVVPAHTGKVRPVVTIVVLVVMVVMAVLVLIQAVMVVVG